MLRRRCPGVPLCAAMNRTGSRSQLVWTSSEPDYAPGDVVWAHRSGDFPGKYRPMLVVGRSAKGLRACAFTTEHHRGSVLVEAEEGNGLHHESWLSLEAEDVAAYDVETRLGRLGPEVTARVLARLDPRGRKIKARRR